MSTANATDLMAKARQDKEKFCFNGLDHDDIVHRNKCKLLYANLNLDLNLYQKVAKPRLLPD